MGRRERAARRHSPAFKLEAVRLMHERLAQGATLERVSRELEVGPDLLRVWAKAVTAHPRGVDAPAEEVFRGVGRPPAQSPKPGETPAAESPEAELARLRREVARLQQEREFLKKAAAFFAKESQ